MAAKVVFSRPALRDLDSILAYIAAENPYAAFRVVEEIGDKCLNLGEMPKMGVEIRPELRRLVVGKYLIFYRLRQAAAHEVEIVRVLHGAQEPPTWLGPK